MVLIQGNSKTHTKSPFNYFIPPKAIKGGKSRFIDIGY